MVYGWFMVINYGWLVVAPTPLKNNGVNVRWDHEIPNWMESHKIHLPNHQPVIINHY